MFDGMRSQGFILQYQVDQVQEKVRMTYDSERETANRICGLYSARGSDFLRPIYNEHRKEGKD